MTQILRGNLEAADLIAHLIPLQRVDQSTISRVTVGEANLLSVYFPSRVILADESRVETKRMYN